MHIVARVKLLATYALKYKVCDVIRMVDHPVVSKNNNS